MIIIIIFITKYDFWNYTKQRQNKIKIPDPDLWLIRTAYISLCYDCHLKYIYLLFIILYLLKDKRNVER